MSDAWDGLPPEEWREKCAWHWFETPHGDRIPILWNYTRWEKNALPNLRTEDCWQAHECRYLAPCLSPAEVAALRERAEKAEAEAKDAREKALREAMEVADGGVTECHPDHHDPTVRGYAAGRRDATCAIRALMEKKPDDCD